MPPPPPRNVSVTVPVGSGVCLGVRGLSTPSLGQFSDFTRQDSDQSRVRDAPGYNLLLNSLLPRAYLTKRLPHAERFRE